MRGYYGNPEATAAAFTDGWFHTGDLGRLDEDGFLYVVDRLKDVIIRGGENIYAAEVEAALYEHPDVAEAAIVGVPHDRLGEEVGAVVRPRAEGTLTAEPSASTSPPAWPRSRSRPRVDPARRVPQDRHGQDPQARAPRLPPPPPDLPTLSHP